MGIAIKTGLWLLRRNLTLVYFIYATKLILAAIVVLPLLIISSNQLEQSKFATILMSEWSMNVVSELIMARQNVFSILLISILIMTVVAIAFRQFVAGGIYSGFANKLIFSAPQFFSDSAKHFAENIRITMLMGVIYAVLFIIALIAGIFVPDGPFRQFGQWSLASEMIRGALMYFFLIPGSIFSDIMRYRAVADPETSTGVRFRQSLDIFKANFVKLLSVYYVWFLPFILFWLLIEWLALSVTQSSGSTFGVVIEFMLFQSCSFGRTVQSLGAIASISVMTRKDGVEIEKQ